MIQINELSMSHGSQVLFHDVQLNLQSGRRYGIVGGNGSGKSTFLRLLADHEQPVMGEILKPKNVRIGWLKQDLQPYQDQPLVDVVMEAVPPLMQAYRQKAHLLNKGSLTEQDCYTLAELEQTIMEHDGYSARSNAEYLLAGLGISESFHDKPMHCLSGGYQIRVLLAQALFEEADVLLLDEPTNYLDIVSVAWFEHFLKNHFQGLVVFVSHDRAFTNRVATDILDIDFNEITHYPGNYDRYIAQKELHMAQKQHDKKHIENKITELNEFIERFKAKPSKAKQARAKLKQVERLQASMPAIKQTSRRYPAFQFKVDRHSGKQVLKVKRLAKHFEHSAIAQGMSFELNRREKAAILGPNGIGKSTLIKMLLGQVTPDAGDYQWGYNADIAYCSQHHHDLLRSQDDTVLTWLEDQTSDDDKRVRQVLGQVLFTQDEVHKHIQDLSGGEATRLLLARVMLMQANVLILDEPTNHLDIEAIDQLTQALQAYQGTMLFVSHEHHFISQIANRILALTPQGLQDFRGGYQQYLYQMGQQDLYHNWLGAIE